MPYTIKLRRGLSTEWASGAVLADGEIGLETDTQNFKVGDGTTEWDSLGYWITGNLPYTPEDVDNKVSAWQVTPDDTHYPSEKLVKDKLDGKQDTLVSASNIKTINTYSILGSGNITVTTDPADLTGFVKFTGSTSALNLTGYDITGKIGHFDTITVTNTANIANLNASTLDGSGRTAFASAAHTHSTYVPYTGGDSNLDLTGYGVTGTTGTFDTLTINLTSLVPNLNADLLDGLEGATYSTTAHTHSASVITFTPTGGIGANDVQGAIEELDSEKQANLSFTLPLSAEGTIISIELSAYATTDSLSAYSPTTTTSGYIPYTGAVSAIDLNGQSLITTSTGIFSALKIPTNPTSGHVLTSDASGNAFWVQPSGGVAWGGITGTLSAQTDLNNALDNRVPYTDAVSGVDLNSQDITANTANLYSATFFGLEGAGGYIDPASGIMFTTDGFTSFNFNGATIHLSGDALAINFGNTPDVGIEKVTAGELKISNGAEGVGNLLLDTLYFTSVSGTTGNFETMTITSSGLISNLNAEYLNGTLSGSFSTTGHTHEASAITFTPTGGISANDVQEAIEELDSEKQANLSFTSPLTANGTTISIELSAYVTTDDLSAYVTTDDLSAYATTDSLSAYSPTTTTSGHVPYTGAVSGVDLNTQNITAGIGTFGSLTTTGTINASSNVSVSGFVYSSQIRIYNTADMSKELIFQTNTNQLNDLTYTWPDGYGDLNQVLTTNASGGLSWTTASGTGAGGLTQAQVLARTLGS